MKIPLIRGFVRRPSSNINRQPPVCPVIKQPYQQTTLQKPNKSAATAAREKKMLFPVLFKKKTKAPPFLVLAGILVFLWPPESLPFFSVGTEIYN